MDRLEALVEYVDKTLETEEKCVLKVFNILGFQYYQNEDQTDELYSAEIIDQLLQMRNDLVCKYFYVYPSIPFQEILYSDERLPKIGELRLLPDYPYERIAGPDEMQRAFEKEYRADFRKFSRWYLVEISKDKAMLTRAGYMKYAVFRDEKHRVKTIQEGNRIYKIPENRETLPHIYHIKRIYECMIEAGIPAMQIQIENDVVQVAFCEGPKWDEFIIEQFHCGGENQLWKELDKVENFFQGISKKKQFKNPYDKELVEIYPEETFVLKVALMDGNINNIMLNAGTPFFIDQEWITLKELPADYLLYFSLLHLSKLLEDIREEIGRAHV